jgi:uncharacterized small protein (TIGR04563 family)
MARGEIRPRNISPGAPGVSPGRDPRPAEPPGPSGRPHANKQCLSFPVDMLKEIEQEALRLDRSVSWVVQRAWKLARIELKKTDPT